MKKIITIIATVFVLGTINAQRELDSLTYDNTQDINFFRKVKNRTLIKKYKTESGNIIKIGDTLILGSPTSIETSTRTNAYSYGGKSRGAIASSRSTSTKTYEFIKMGRPAGFSSVMSGLNGTKPIMASNNFKKTKVLVNEIKAYHRGSKKKPLYLVMVLGEINGRAFGANKYLSVMDTELAIESGEVLLKNRKMTRAEAIAKLKEAKELMDIEMMDKEEFNALKKKLGPIIRNQKN